MFVIKQRKKSRYLVRDENDFSVTFNLHSDPELATQFNNRIDAERVLNEVVENAERERAIVTALIDSSTKIDDSLLLEVESILEYLSMIVTEKK